MQLSRQKCQHQCRWPDSHHIQVMLVLRVNFPSSPERLGVAKGSAVKDKNEKNFPLPQSLTGSTDFLSFVDVDALRVPGEIRSRAEKLGKSSQKAGICGHHALSSHFLSHPLPHPTLIQLLIKFSQPHPCSISVSASKFLYLYPPIYIATF